MSYFSANALSQVAHNRQESSDLRTHRQMAAPLKADYKG
jgi:hypothetical protein